MSNPYTPMLQALQAHWKTNANAYPQKFVLTATALEALNTSRKLVNESIATKQSQGWEKTFMGVKLEVGPTNVMVGEDGTETLLA
jgi:hypothetical protein